EKVSLGCSYKGRIWSHAKGDIHDLIEWCDSVGKKLIRNDIDPNTILKETLTPNSISIRPKELPFTVDWNEFVYLEPETRITFVLDSEVEFYQTELQLIEPTDKPDLYFEIVTPQQSIAFKLILFRNGDYDDF